MTVQALRSTLAALFSFSAFLIAPDAPASIAPDAPKVIVTTVSPVEEADSLLFPARVSSLVQTKIFAEFDGIVRSLPLTVGTRVTRRSEILVIRHIDPVYRYAPMRVTSPVAGVVSSVEVTEGTQVNKGDLLATVTDPAKIRISIEVPAQDLSSLKPGLRGEFKAGGLKGPLPVRVIGVSPFVDPKTGTAVADLEIIPGPKSAPLEAPMPGTLGQATLRTNIHPAISIPEDAITYRDGKAMARILIDGKMKLSPIEIGTRRRGSVEVKTGLQANDRLILRSSKFVSEGEEVQIEKEKPAEASAPAQASTAKS